jgi:hypothetical protein
MIGPLQQATRSIPIVFVIAPDPVGAGFVQSTAQVAASPSTSVGPSTRSTWVPSKSRTRQATRASRELAAGFFGYETILEDDDPKEIRADFLHLRKWRKSVEQAQSLTFNAMRLRETTRRSAYRPRSHHRSVCRV